MIPRINWIIKNEDLQLIDSLLEGLKTAAGVSFFMAPSIDSSKTWPAIIGIFSTVFKLARNVKNKSKIIDSTNFKILLLLKLDKDGLELNYLHYLLNSEGIELSIDELKVRLDD